MAKNRSYKHTYKNVSIPEQNPFESEAMYYKRLAKMADTRLRRLEKMAQTDPKYKHVKEWAYSNAMDDIKALFGQNAKRFDVTPVKTTSGAVDMRFYNARLNAVKRFLSSPTSTKGDIRAAYDYRAQTINRKYGTSFTWETIAGYMEGATSEKMDKHMGSETKLKLIGKLQKDGKDVMKVLKSYNPRNRKGDKLGQYNEEWLKNIGVDPDEFLSLDKDFVKAGRTK